MMTVNVVRPGEVVIVLVELGVAEQRYQVVLEVLNNASTVTDVAVRFGVTRQTVHRWLRRYAANGISGLVDGSACSRCRRRSHPPPRDAGDAVDPWSAGAVVAAPVGSDPIRRLRGVCEGHTR